MPAMNGTIHAKLVTKSTQKERYGTIDGRTLVANGTCSDFISDVNVNIPASANNSTTHHLKSLFE